MANQKPFSGRSDLAKAFLVLKQDLIDFFDQHPEQDVTGFTLSVNMGECTPILYHKPSSIGGADLSILMVILGELATENVAMEYIPLARAVKVLCTPETPTYCIFAANNLGPTAEFFACAPPAFLQQCHEHLGRILSGNYQNQLASESRKFRGEPEPESTTNVIPFPPTTKH